MISHKKVAFSCFITTVLTAKRLYFSSHCHLFSLEILVRINFSEFQNSESLCTFSLFLFPAIFERLRNVLHESTIDKRVQYMIEVMFAIRKDGFKDHPVIPEGLDLVDEDDQFTHMLPLDDEYNPEDILSKT